MALTVKQLMPPLVALQLLAVLHGQYGKNELSK